MSADSVSTQISECLQLLRRQWQQQFQLLTLETQRAAESLVAIWLLALFATLLLLSSWVLLLVLLGTGMLAFGLMPWQTIAVLLLLQLMVLLMSLRGIRYYSQFLRFPATQQSWSDAVQASTAKEEKPECPVSTL